MKKPELFLKLFREYETLLRERGSEPIEEETRMEDEVITKNRLRLCRQFRNYLVHSADVGFLEVSDKMYSFLEQYHKDLIYQEDVAKKHLRSMNSATCKPTDKCSIALEKMLKLKQDYLIIVTDDSTFHTIDIYSVLKTTKSAKINTLKPYKRRVLRTEPTQLMIGLDRSDFSYVCIDNGKCLGIVK